MRCFRRLAALSLAICALATAVPAAAQHDDERSTAVSMQAAPPNVTASAGDSLRATNPISRAMQYVDSMPASTFYTSLAVLVAAVMLLSRVVERRGRRLRNGDDEDDNNARVHQRFSRRSGITVMSASPGGGY